MKKDITIIHAYSDRLEVKVEPSRYAQSGYAYMVPDQKSLIEFSRTVWQADKEKNEWIRRYQNVLNGLNYWREKALESKT